MKILDCHIQEDPELDCYDPAPFWLNFSGYVFDNFCYYDSIEECDLKCIEEIKKWNGTLIVNELNEPMEIHFDSDSDLTLFLLRWL